MNIDYICNNIKNKNMKPKNVKQAMSNDSWMVKNIHEKGNKQIRVDFKRRFAAKEDNFVSFWIDRNYFERMYPKTYAKFSF